MVAFACRYGRAGLNDVLSQPTSGLAMFNRALAGLIKEENVESNMAENLADGSG